MCPPSFLPSFTPPSKFLILTPSTEQSNHSPHRTAPHQGDREEQKARATSLREEAEAREQEARVAKLQELGKAGDQQAREELRRIEGGMLLLKDKEEITKATQRFDDRDDEADDDDDEGVARGKGNGGGSDSDSDLDSSDSDDEDEDDEELLRLELEKIKRVRSFFLVGGRTDARMDGCSVMCWSSFTTRRVVHPSVHTS